MNLAAQGDTWGIPGPAFLVLYFAATVAVLILSAIHRRVLFAGDRRAELTRLGPQQVAYLNGGDQLAVYAALGGLRGAGAIAGGPGKTLYQAGPMPAGVTPLDNAIYNAAGRRIRARDLAGDQWVVAAVRQLREGLEAQGLAVPEARRKTAQAWSLAGLALLVLGVGRLVDGIQNDKPVGFLVVAIVIAGIVTVVLLTRKRRATHAADKGMAALRQQHAYLSPGQSPSYATYGATGAAMGVALYGTAALYTMDPAFAAEAEVQRINSSTGSNTGGGDSGSSSSCGGGSSSCGGGGGCGGGGCGG
ncbi:TIGR04222 domain-containing membrane protein [Actinoplanes sp. NPDC049599]|uniref:TIGR04222 domain-containing membrane protein n=1 Tax=Actinoplanes sp. NPDC049599 TaxID=3363903 RepID=UPI0037B3E118